MSIDGWLWMGWASVAFGGWSVGAQEPSGSPDAASAAIVETARTAAPRPIDLALCLDTSGSMDGLIEATKHKLWSIVNELARAEPTPRLRVALLTFGNDGHLPEDGWVRVDVGLTEDLDLVSQHLFALRTNGGTELVGRVVARAARTLEWTPDPGALELIVVAGNESADQDTEIRAFDAAGEAIRSGILVNTIYCGSPSDPIAAEWQAVARAADGQFACIDHQSAAQVITTPFDAELASLGAAVNETYVPIGTSGATAWANQAQQDVNAAGLNAEAAAERAICKNTTIYQCNWDLVDACRAGTVKLEEVKVEDLPETMRSMTLEERRAHVDAQWARRSAIQAQVGEIAQRRESWIAEQRAQGTLEGESSLDRALLDALRSQASAAGFVLPAPPAPRVSAEPFGPARAVHALRAAQARAAAAASAAPAQSVHAAAQVLAPAAPANAQSIGYTAGGGAAAPVPGPSPEQQQPVGTAGGGGR